MKQFGYLIDDFKLTILQVFAKYIHIFSKGSFSDEAQFVVWSYASTPTSLLGYDFAYSYNLTHCKLKLTIINKIQPLIAWLVTHGMVVHPHVGHHTSCMVFIVTYLTLRHMLRYTNGQQLPLVVTSWHLAFKCIYWYLCMSMLNCVTKRMPMLHNRLQHWLDYTQMTLAIDVLKNSFLLHTKI